TSLLIIFILLSGWFVFFLFRGLPIRNLLWHHIKNIGVMNQFEIREFQISKNDVKGRQDLSLFGPWCRHAVKIFQEFDALLTIVCHDPGMEKKKESRIETWLKKRMDSSLSYWLVLLLFTLFLAAVVFGIVAISYVVENVLTPVQSFYTEFVFCTVLALVFLVFVIRCILRRKRSAAVMLAAAAAVFVFFSARFALDLPYLNNPPATTLHNISLEMKIDYSPDSTVHYYMLYGYDDEGKMQSLEVDVNTYDDFRSRADTAVVTYLPHSHKIMNIDFF
ncbi:MAG: hypothetical protein ACI4OJ_12755, partial [Lachnospiraceae bacterium]